MLRRMMPNVPPPPGAGLKKIADPRQVWRHWLSFLLVVFVLGAAFWSHGLGAALERMRRDFVAIEYLKAAQAKSNGKVVQRDQALADLKRAVELAPTHPVIADNAAQLYVSLRAYKDAIPWLRQQQNRSRLAKVSLGQSLLMTGQVAEGERVLQQILDESELARQHDELPDALYALLLNNVGYVHVQAGRNAQRALELIKQAVRLSPQQPAYIDSLGWAEYRLGHYRNAAFYVERAVRLLAPEESAELYYHLGAAYAKIGRRTDAAVALRKALAIDSSYAEAREALHQLSLELPSPALAQLPTWHHLL